MSGHHVTVSEHSCGADLTCTCGWRRLLWWTVHPLPDACLVQQVDGRLLEHAGAPLVHFLDDDVLLGPAMLARMAGAVDDLSGGRLTLGVGGGWQEREHHLFGLPR